MDRPVRVRFAPSPTGRPHVGNIRTAIFDYLMARHYGGTFVLRIEDTDVARKVAGAVEYMMDALHWLGIDWDEGPDKGGDYGPYYQSQRLHLYTGAAERLVAQGNAYYCYCTPERLEEVRQQRAARKDAATGYDRTCRNLTLQERAEKDAASLPKVIRFKVPETGSIGFTDAIYGDLSFDLATQDDFVMLKSDGYPTYHLASVVDDHFMEISHVIRAEEWISSTPRHILMYRDLGWEPPQFVHHPLIVGPDRAKLSKRHGSTSILDYREQGYLPETMLNFLSLIGWSLDEKTEIMSQPELIDYFSLDRIGKSGAVFNRDKLDWMNGVYIRGLECDDLAHRLMPFLEDGLPAAVTRPIDEDYVRKIVPLVQERITTLKGAVAYAGFFFLYPDYDPAELVGKKMDAAGSLVALRAAADRLAALEGFDPDGLEAVLRPFAGELGIKAGQLFGILRTAVTGRTATPPLFETMTVLGRQQCLQRIRSALGGLEKLAGSKEGKEDNTAS
jgi:glutamyl-tRNA synthetase